jgi:hypothetical protein
LIDNAFNFQSGTLARAVEFLSGDDRSLDGMNGEALARVREHFDRFGVPYAQAFLASVPEPATIALASACCVLSGRRPGARRGR